MTKTEKCQECDSFLLDAMYKDNSPFPGGVRSRTGCILCDSVMKSTLVNFFFKQQRMKTPQELEEEAKAKEERKRAKEEKKKKREEEEKLNPKPAGDQAKKKKKKEGGATGQKKPNILTQQDKIAEFMRKMHGEEHVN